MEQNTRADFRLPLDLFATPEIGMAEMFQRHGVTPSTALYFVVAYATRQNWVVAAYPMLAALRAGVTDTWEMGFVILETIIMSDLGFLMVALLMDERFGCWRSKAKYHQGCVALVLHLVYMLCTMFLGLPFPL